MLFIDLQKTFDTTDHRILVCKLCNYGIDQTSLSWLENLNRWLVANRLNLSVTKTDFMVIGSHQRIHASGHEEINVKINGKSITRVHKVKSLGLLIDEHLTWKDHVDEVVNKISNAIGALK